MNETDKRPSDIPCIVFPNRAEITEYLGYRHVTGVKTWGIRAKARYLHYLIPTLTKKGLHNQSRELAKKIGSRSDYVKRMLVSYNIYEIIKDNNFYKIPKLDETTLHFNYIADSLRYENIQSFININLNNDNTVADIDKNNLKILIDLFFRKNDKNKSRVLGNSENLTKLNKILLNKEITTKFIKELTLDEAFNLIEINSDTFYNEINQSLRSLKTAHSYIHQIKDHNSSDITILKEIVDLCKIIRNSIQSKEDDWNI
jgi:hypothetical protein